MSRATESVTDHGYPYVAERMMPGDLSDYFEGLVARARLGFFARLWLLISTTFKALIGQL